MMFPKNKPIRDPKLLKGFHGFCVKHDVGCLKCGSPNIQIHHGIYRSQGGSDTWNNLYPLCQTCHEYVHFEGKPQYHHIVKLKGLEWRRLEQKLQMDLSKHLDS
jgi:5-methylcytosine-specific restriction endonuclease McrA